MADLRGIAQDIRRHTQEIDQIRLLIKQRGTEKAFAIAQFEREMAIVMIKLKNGIEFELDGQKIINPPATIMKEIARGICYDLKLKMETAEALYKSALVNLEAVSANLNALPRFYRLFYMPKQTL